MGSDGEPNVIKVHDHDNNLYILNHGPIFVFIAASSQAGLKNKKIAILITQIHKVNTVVFRRCLYFLSVGSIGDCYDYKKLVHRLIDKLL